MIAPSAWLAVAILHAVAAGNRAPTAAMQAATDEAFAACQTGDWRRGNDVLARLYAETVDPEYLAAQGRCMEVNHKLDEAIRYYREYLRVARDAPAEARKRVQGYLEAAEQEQKAQQAQAPAITAAPVPTTPTAMDPTALTPAPSITDRAEDSAAPPFYTHAWFWVATAVVVAAGVVGVVLATSARDPGMQAFVCTTCNDTVDIGATK